MDLSSVEANCQGFASNLVTLCSSAQQTSLSPDPIRVDRRLKINRCRAYASWLSWKSPFPAAPEQQVFGITVCLNFQIGKKALLPGNKEHFAKHSEHQHSNKIITVGCGNESKELWMPHLEHKDSSAILYILSDLILWDCNVGCSDRSHEWRPSAGCISGQSVPTCLWIWDALPASKRCDSPRTFTRWGLCL